MIWISCFVLSLAACWLGYRHLRARRARVCLQRMRDAWHAIDTIWNHIAALQPHVWNPDVRTAAAELLRAQATLIASNIGSDTKLQAERQRMRGFLRGTYKPPTPRQQVQTKDIIHAAKDLYERIERELTRQTTPDPTLIRASAALQQIEARHQVDRLATQALRQRMGGKRRDAMTSLTQARHWLRFLPQTQADALIEKFSAEQALLRRR